MQIPKDTKEMTEKYKIDKGGICGQACLAIIENLSISNVLDNWKNLGLEFKGWSGWRQLKTYLEKRGYIVNLKRMNNLGNFKFDAFYILRVQYLGDLPNQDKPFYGHPHWSIASAYTHFIVLHQGEIFCNETGIFDYHGLKDYLKDNATVTSAMEVYKDVQKN